MDVVKRFDKISHFFLSIKIILVFIYGVLSLFHSLMIKFACHLAIRNQEFYNLVLSPCLSFCDFYY